MTTRYCIIGHPISHSKSPRLHNAAFKLRGLDAHYTSVDIAPNELPARFRSLIEEGFRGMNVTVPHKESIIPLLDTLSPSARAIGAVNTIVVDDDGRTHGYNTDCDGFLADLSAHHIDVKNIPVTILGAGGCARAIAYALLSAGASRLHILNRSVVRANQLQGSLKQYFPHTPIHFHERNSKAFALATDTPLIVNCTSLGMNNLSLSPWPELEPFFACNTLYDTIYTPSETAFLRQGKSYGARAINGKGMLIHQAALAFSLWTKEQVSAEFFEGVYDSEPSL